MRKKVLAVVSILSLFIVLMGGSILLGWSRTAEKNELVILQGSIPENPHPARNSSFENALPLTCIYEGLVKLNPRTLDPEPNLAESWSVSDDGRRWAFHLKPGVLFSDGTPCDAGFVISSFMPG